MIVKMRLTLRAVGHKIVLFLKVLGIALIWNIQSAAEKSSPLKFFAVF